MMVSILLQRPDIDVTYIDQVGNSLLHYLLRNNEFARELIERKVYVNHRNSEGLTPMMKLFSDLRRVYGVDENLVDVLLKNGAVFDDPLANQTSCDREITEKGYLYHTLTSHETKLAGMLIKHGATVKEEHKEELLKKLIRLSNVETATFALQNIEFHPDICQNSLPTRSTDCKLIFILLVYGAVFEPSCISNLEEFDLTCELSLLQAGISTHGIDYLKNVSNTLTQSFTRKKVFTTEALEWIAKQRECTLTLKELCRVSVRSSFLKNQIPLLKILQLGLPRYLQEYLFLTDLGNDSKLPTKSINNDETSRNGHGYNSDEDHYIYYDCDYDDYMYYDSDHSIYRDDYSDYE